LRELLSYVNEADGSHCHVECRQNGHRESRTADSKQTTESHDIVDVVHLNVGGQHFTTTIHRLTRDIHSPFFKKLIGEQWDRTVNTASNPIFIDRDGNLFRYILNYLRTGELIVSNETVRTELLIEAKYYQLTNLQHELRFNSKKDQTTTITKTMATVNSVADRCLSADDSHASIQSSLSSYSLMSHTNHPTHNTTMNNATSSAEKKRHPAQIASSWKANVIDENCLKIFTDSKLLTLEYEEKLVEFINLDVKLLDNRPWRLIYRASEHGFDAADFHRCCDTFAPTISIIQTDFGNLFGGFTTVPWSSATLRSNQADEKAFLFTLKNTVQVPPTRFPISEAYKHCAISHNPTCGPNFGSPTNNGSDLCLRNKFTDKTNFIFFPRSYVDTTNIGSTIFAKRYFACKEVEVFAYVSVNEC
jgi:hypothetical protein